MYRQSLLLIGAGGHANSCIDVIEKQGEFSITGLIGLPEELKTQHFNYEVIGNDSDLEELAKIHKNALITLGQIETPDHRIKLYKQIFELGFELPTIVSPFGHTSNHSEIGSGTIVMHGAIINAGAKIGKNCIVNSNALVEHDSVVEDHCHISTGAIINGGVQVREGSFIGSRSVLKEGITVGRKCIIGMGQTVMKDLDDESRFTSKRNDRE